MTMRTVSLLGMLAGVSALSKPSSSDIMRMTLKSRAISDVSLDMEAEDAQEQNPEGRTHKEEIGGARLAFAGYVLLTAGASVATYKYIKGPGAVEAAGSSEQNLEIYNKVAPSAMLTMATVMFFSVVGAIVALNNKAYTTGTKTNFPGYEGQAVAYERIDNPGERAFFASFALAAQAILGLMVCLYLRKQQQVQTTTAMILKMACRGAAAGILATLSVEFIRLPFHDYLMNEEIVVSRVFTVLLWVGFIAIIEEVMKIAAVAAGRSENDPEAPVAESPQVLAICGLAAGMGFAFVENIPRIYALACQRPLAKLDYSSFGNASESFLISEESLRAQRIWTFVFWGLLNVQPWLTGLAAIQLAKITGKGPIAPLDWITVLKFAVTVHFFFDLLDRSTHPLIELLGCCAIPYAMYTFKKTWESLSSSDDEGLLGDRE